MAVDLSNILESMEPIHLAGGGPTEGPLWHPGEYLTFVRHRMSQLMRWDLNGSLSTVRENTGEGNGVKATQPRWMEVETNWRGRGGIRSLLTATWLPDA